MEISFTQTLCQILISSSIQRCRISDDLCRLSVVLKRSPDSDPHCVQVSISDTGVGSCLAEFQDLNCTRNNISYENWDGMLSITTTSICDNEIFHYHLNLKENVAARKLTRLPSSPKNGVKFSGTEVSLSSYESIDEVVSGITRFFQKMLILKIRKLAVDLVIGRVNDPASRCENLLMANEGILFPSPVSNIERMTSGLEDYVLKHGNMLDKECPTCFLSREHLKVGSGVACSKNSVRSTGQVVEAVIIISELPEPASPSCLRECSTTEVLYFQDFTPSSLLRSSLNSWTSIDWKSYGLNLINVVDGNGCTVLEWENVPPFTHIDIVIHSYHKKVIVPEAQQKTQVDRKLVKQAVKVALDDLKQRYKGTLLSTHALKICSYAPDLARTIAGLILSSNDSEFQGQCFSILELQPQELGQEKEVEDSIMEKIITVIEMNDRKPQREREPAPFLFEDGNIHEPEFQDEEGEEGFNILEL